MSRWLHDLYRRWSGGQRSPALWLYGVPAAGAEILYRVGAAIDRTRHPALQPLSERIKLAVVTSPLVGGVGKTPFVAHLAPRLKANGNDSLILSRGYHRSGTGDVTIIPGQELPDVRMTGDEPLMLANETGIPVAVTSDVARWLIDFGRTPAREGSWVIIDDGVRNRWEGERRIAVFADSDLERTVRYLPYGRWRVPPESIWPVCGVVITGADSPQSRSDVHRRFLERIGYSGPIGWYRRVAGPIGIYKNRTLSPVEEVDEPLLAFSGLGMPDRFASDIQTLGANLVDVVTFPDHHRYTESDLTQIIQRCRKAGGGALLTTHKDAMKIDPAWNLPVPIYVLRISLELAAGDDMLPVILE